MAVTLLAVPIAHDCIAWVWHIDPSALGAVRACCFRRSFPFRNCVSLHMCCSVIRVPHVVFLGHLVLLYAKSRVFVRVEHCCWQQLSLLCWCGDDMNLCTLACGCCCTCFKFACFCNELTASSPLYFEVWHASKKRWNMLQRRPEWS